MSSLAADEIVHESQGFFMYSVYTKINVGLLYAAMPSLSLPFHSVFSVFQVSLVTVSDNTIGGVSALALSVASVGRRPGPLRIEMLM